ncbi:two-component response regulator ORR21 [Euphorbia lathyris]|uniref:two-component response regulator ORR21 n=1 Tax=Euphorbia lathyris TaxID=212925 RepID=UPI003313D539
MAALQRVQSTVGATASNYNSCKNGGAIAAAVVSEQFPAGLRVLVVDDDITCLTVIERMLRRCHYHVTTSTQAKVALSLLRERKGCFDVVLSDVHMPDMDGFKLLEFVGLEMDLPVIMMSADERTSVVMKGIKHGACDYLIKPIREEELKNIWQHVVRKKWHENKEIDSESLDDNDRYKRGNDDTEYASSSLNEGSEGVLKGQKKRSISKEEDDGEPESDDPTTSKKPRVVWSVELHEQFVNAVTHLGIDKAVPKGILELMNVPGLTRENVASHLQKFRLFLKRLSDQQSGISSTFCGPLDSNLKLHSLGRLDIQALAASGQIPPQTLAALHAELLGRPTSSLVATMDQPTVFHMQGKCIPVEHGLAFGQPLSKCQSDVSKHFPQNMVSVEDVSLGFGGWSEPGHSINVQPSCLIAPSPTSTSFEARNSPASGYQNCNFNGSSIIDNNLLPSQLHNSSLNIGHMSNEDLKFTTGVLSGYSVPESLSPTSQGSINAHGCLIRPNITFGAAARHLSGLTPDVQGIYGLKSGEILDQVPLRNLGFVGKWTSIPTRFALNEYETTLPNFNHGKFYTENNGNKVKHEPNMEFVDIARVQFSPNDPTRVFTR